MPATRSQSTAPRTDPLATPSPPRAHNHSLRSSDSLTFSSPGLEESTIPLKSKRKDKTQQRQRPPKPVIVPGEIIEISDDDDDPPPHLNSQTSMIADFRRQINKLREVSLSASIGFLKLLMLFSSFRNVSSTRKITSGPFENLTTFVKKTNNCKPFENPVL